MVNQRTPAGGCRRCGVRANAERAVLRTLPGALQSLTRHLPMRPREPRGLRDLRGLARDLAAARRGLGSAPRAPRSPAPPARTRRAGAPEWLARLAPAGTRLVIVLGKGGVGIDLLDLVDHVLTQGVVVTGDVMLVLADVDLVYLRLTALLCAADRILPRAAGMRRAARGARR